MSATTSVPADTHLFFTSLVKNPDFPSLGPEADRLILQLHFFELETYLRAKDVSDLPARLQEKRLTALDALHRYWTQGVFPQNVTSERRTPVFIDHHDTFCAVGYLMRQDHHEHLARRIAETDLMVKAEAFVEKDFNDGEILAWIENSGFTREEIALIQPGYPTTCSRFAPENIPWDERVVALVALCAVLASIYGLLALTYTYSQKEEKKFYRTTSYLGLLTVALIASTTYLFSHPNPEGWENIYFPSATSSAKNYRIVQLFTGVEERQKCYNTMPGAISEVSP